MPKYFFHVYVGEQRIEEDQYGLELADFAEAQEKYAGIIQATLSETEWAGELKGGREFRVLDEQGHVILKVPFGHQSENRNGKTSNPALYGCPGS
jgi:hypothetical protein